MKKIVIISTGSFIHLPAYLDFYRKQGLDVSLLAITPFEWNPDDFRVFNLSKIDSQGAYWKKFVYLVNILKVRRIIRKLNVDFIHAHYATSGGLTAWLASGKVPYIITVHGSDIFNSKKSIIWRVLLKKIFRKASVVNTVSQELSELVLKLGAEKEKVVEVPVGVDVDLFKSDVKRDWSKLKLICTRAFEPVYNHKVIIEALSILRQQGVNFEMLFVGEGSTRVSCEELVNEYGLTDFVTFEPRLPNSRLPELLKQYNYYISASLRDGTSVCLLEAMANGLIPIVSNIRANRDWLTEGVNGYLFRPHDGLELCNKIRLAHESLDGNRGAMEGANLEVIRVQADRTVLFNKLLNQI